MVRSAKSIDAFSSEFLHMLSSLAETGTVDFSRIVYRVKKYPVSTEITDLV